MSFGSDGKPSPQMERDRSSKKPSPAFAPVLTSFTSFTHEETKNTKKDVIPYIYIYKYLSIATPDPPVSRTARVDLRGTSQEELGHLLSDQPQVTKVSSRRRPTCVPSGALMELWSLQWVVIPLFCCIVLFNFQCAFPLRDSDGDGPCGYFQKKPSMNGTTSTPKWNIA